MPLQQFQKDWLLKQVNKDPSQFDVLDSGQIVPKQTAQPVAVSDNGVQQPLVPAPRGAGATFVKEAIHAAPAAVGGGIGAALGTAAGIALAPATGGLSIAIPAITGIGGALLGGTATSAIQEKAEEALVPDYVAQRQANLAANPWSGVAGRLAAMPLGGMNPSLVNPVMAGGTAARMIANPLAGRRILQNVGGHEVANLANVGIGTGIGTGMAVGQQLAQGQSLGDIATSPETLEGVAGGLLFSKPNAIGQKIFGFEPTPEISQMRKFLQKRQAPVAPPTVNPVEQAIANINARPPQLNPLDLLRRVSSTTEPIIRETPEGVDISRIQGEQAMFPLLSAEQAAQQTVIPRASLQSPEYLASQADLARSAHNNNIIRELNRKTEEARVAKAQAEHAKAVADLQQTMAGQQLAKIPEVRPAPRVTTEMGAEIYPDYTGAVEAENMVRDVRGEEADTIQDRLERRQETDEGLTDTPEMQLARQRLQQEGLSANLSPEQLAAFQAKARTRGVDVTANPELQAKGTTYFPSDREALQRIAVDINPDKAGVDTPMHEGAGHAFFQFLRESPFKSDRDMIARYEQLVKDSGVLEKLNAERAKQGKKPWDVEEFMASQQGVEAVLRDPQINKESEFKNWWGDFKAHMKDILGRADERDIRRIIDYKWHTDPAFEAYFGKGASKGIGVRSGQQLDQDAFRDMNERIGWKSQVENPTPGSMQSIEKYGNAEDEIRSVQAVADGTKPITGSYVKPSSLPEGVELIKVTDSDVAGWVGRYLIRRKGDTESYNRLLRAVSSGDGWEVGKALGYTDQEIQEFGTRLKMIDVYERKHGRMYQQPFDEGFNTREGDDVLSASPQEQDIEVRDALPTKLPAAPAGYRRVKVVKPDGGSYEAFFNDKYFPGTGKLFGPDMPDLASLAKVLPDGSLTHSATKPGEKIEELPSQLYRREQPEGEGMNEPWSSKAPYNHEYWSNNFGDYKQGNIDGKPWVLSNKNKGLFLKSGGKWYDKTLFAVNPDGTPATISSIIKYGKANEVEHPHVIEFLERSTRQLPNRTLEQPENEGLTTKSIQEVEQQLSNVRKQIQRYLDSYQNVPDSLIAERSRLRNIVEESKQRQTHQTFVDKLVSRPADKTLPLELQNYDPENTVNKELTIQYLKHMRPSVGEVYAGRYLVTKVTEADGSPIYDGIRESLADDFPANRIKNDFRVILTDLQTGQHNIHSNSEMLRAIHVEGKSRQQPSDEGLTGRKAYYKRYDAQKKQELDAIRKQAMQQDTTLSRRNVGYAQATPEGERMPLGFISDTRKAILNKKIENAVANIVTRIGAKGSNLTHIKGEDLADIKAAVMADISTKGLDTDRSNPLTSTIYRRTYAEINKLIAQKKLEPKTSLNQKTASDKELSEIVAQAEDTGSEAVTAEEAIQIWESRLAKAPEQMKPLIEAELDRLSELHPEEFVDVEAVESKLIEQLKKQGTKREQGEDEGLADKRTFMTSAERVLKSTVKGFQPVDQVLNTLRNKIPPTEWQILKDAGIEEAFGPAQRVDAQEVQKWIDENGPRVEVRKFGEGSSTEDSRFMAQMTHRLDTQGGKTKERLLKIAKLQRAKIHEFTSEFGNKEVTLVDDNGDSVINDSYSTDNPNKTLQQVGEEVKQEKINKLLKLVENEAGISKEDALRVIDLSENEFVSKQGQSHWQSVAPKPESEMKDYVEIAVVKSESRLKYVKDAEGNITHREPYQFPSSHNFPPDTLGFVRGYMEGDTFHVVEVQSDWAQHYRNEYVPQIKDINNLPEGMEIRNDPYPPDSKGLYYKGRRISGGYTKEEILHNWNNEAYGRSNPTGDPLLSHYERLALKAAIEHARESGAKRIAIQDAESAMLMEGHDRAHKVAKPVPVHDVMHPDNSRNLYYNEKPSQVRKEFFGEDWAQGKYVEVNGRVYRVDKPENNFINESSKEYAKKLLPFAEKEGIIIDQEPGMRLHYDQILPKILSELTGSKGEKVSFGEHKMAFEQNRSTQHLTREQLRELGAPPKRLRPDLIFRNPDGTPKTDVSARVYNLPERKQPFSYTEKRSQGLDEGLSTYESTGPVGKAILSKIAPEVEKLRSISEPAAEGATKFYELNRAYKGQLEQSLIREVRKAAQLKLKDIRSYESLMDYIYQDNKDTRAVVQYFDALMDGETPNALTTEQQNIAKAVKANLKQSLDLRESFPDLGDIEGLARGTKGNPNYLPHVMSRVAAKELADNPTGAKAAQLFDDFVEYRTTKRGQSVEEATQDWDTLRSMFTLQEGGDIASKFGAIDKAAGLGLPKSMREQNLLDRMSRFNRRFARRVAYHEAIQRNPEVSKAFFDRQTGVASTETGKNVLEDIFGIREHTEATHQALSGVVRAAMLGPLTGAKDVVSGQVLGLQHMDLGQVLPAKLDSLKNLADNYERAWTSGILRENIGGLETGEGGLKQIHNVLGRSRDIINTVQGRNLLENVSRVLNFGEGRYLALDALMNWRKGKLSKQQEKFLENFMPDYEQHKAGEVDSAVLDEAAAKYVESVQGTYDYRGLPAIAMKGTLSPYLSLARWNVEKFNNFTKHVVDPAMNGDFKPLLMSTIGMFVGGAAVNELVEQVTGRKQRTATWNEVANSPEQMELLSYKLAALASLSGYAGVLGDATKTYFDWRNKNRVQTWNNPLVDAMSTAWEDLGFLHEALQDGNMIDITDALHMVAQDYIQAYRVMLPHFSEEKQQELEMSNKRRDLKVFKSGFGYPVSPASTERPNPLVGQGARDFKRTEDVAEAARMLPDLWQEAIEDSKDANGNIQPEVLKNKLSALKRNSYQTVPSPTETPMQTGQYLNWLSATQGKQTAEQRMVDYVRRNAINKAKSSLVPSL